MIKTAFPILYKQGVEINRNKEPLGVFFYRKMEGACCGQLSYISPKTYD